MSVIRVGICSVTLRSLPAAEVAAVASAAGLECVEWGGDIHVPAGDTILAEQVAALTSRAGLTVASYGSYFRAGVHAHSEFEKALTSARALNAPRIRIWAGQCGSAEADPEYRRAVVAAAQRAADSAFQHEIDLAFEFHHNSLTDDVNSTLTLLTEIDRINVTTYWQPPVGLDDAAATSTLVGLGNLVSAVHVFSWWPETERLALADREPLWRSALAALTQRSAPSIDALLEFVARDDPANVIDDSATLRRLL